MKHTIKLLTLAATLVAVFGLTGCPGPVNNYIEPVHEHVWAEVTTEYVAPTCTTKGSKTYVCNLCGETKVEELDALGHNFGDWTVVTPETCTTNGSKKRVCSRCGHEETETILAHHNFICGGCDNCGTFEFTGENNYQLKLSLYREKVMTVVSVNSISVSSINTTYSNDDRYDFVEDVYFSFREEDFSKYGNTFGLVEDGEETYPYVNPNELLRYKRPQYIPSNNQNCNFDTNYIVVEIEIE